MSAELEFKVVSEEAQEYHEEAPQSDPATESEARTMGWRPKEEFHGDEAHWVDADTFLKRGREITPILRENNRKLLNELKTARDEIGELKLTVKEFGEMYGKLAENAYKKAQADLRAQERAARNEGDYELADTLHDQYEQLKEDSKNIQIPKVREAAQPTDQQTRWVGILQDWHADNAWYDKDRALTRQMNAIAHELAQNEPSLLGKRALLDRAVEILKEDMPEKFVNKERSKGSPVSGSEESRSGTRSSGKAARDLPADARTTGERMVKQGLFKDLNEYAAAYFDQ